MTSPLLSCNAFVATRRTRLWERIRRFLRRPRRTLVDPDTEYEFSAWVRPPDGAWEHVLRTTRTPKDRGPFRMDFALGYEECTIAYCALQAAGSWHASAPYIREREASEIAGPSNKIGE